MALPIELLRDILGHCQLDDLLTARAANKTLLHASNISPGSLIHDIVSNHIEESVLQDAIYVSKIAQLRDPSVITSVLHPDFAGLYHESKQTPLDYDWSLSEGIAAVRLHSVVERFASDFASFYLSNFQRYSKFQNESPPSAQELTRIKRALYRFEMFCRLFPPPAYEEHDDEDSKAAKTSFLSSLSPWEREQLSSVHNSLWRQITPAFNDVALHDIYYGKFMTAYVSDFDDTQTEWILSHGLQRLFKYSRAETFAERHQLFGNTVPPVALDFLHRSFECHNFMILRSNSISGSKGRPLCNDPDPGPERAWRWSHPFESQTELSNEVDYEAERACGYVFWDEKRLERSGLLDNDWTDTNIETEELICTMAPTLEEEFESWNIRERLYDNGARGYWERG